MFQFFIIKNGLQLIHSFAAISWKPITIAAQTTSDVDSQTARKNYRCTNFPQWQIQLICLHSLGIFYKTLYKLKTVTQGLDYSIELDFSISENFDLTLTMAPCYSITKTQIFPPWERTCPWPPAEEPPTWPYPYPTCTLQIQSLLFPGFLSSFKSNLFSQAHQFSLETPWGSSRVGNNVYIFARHSA